MVEVSATKNALPLNMRSDTSNVGDYFFCIGGEGELSSGGSHYYKLLQVIEVDWYSAAGYSFIDFNLASTYVKIGVFIIASLVGRDGGVVVGLASCGVMLSIVSTAADLMQDLKTGYLTLSSAKSMFVSQPIGTAMGCIIAPLTIWLFWSGFEIGSPDSPYKAPYAMINREMAILGVEGFSELPKHCLALCCGFFVAALLINVLRDVTDP
ncbi:hypothetical protein POM88_035909 [Heracleum sosnowskyi]|uniref:Uncharacterized protein n=1 Tax=Heracleum sosnowskyi TaxID=360622 RepID=A0AAD8HM63_9APIA|nr:hypothetical protein POM88_035909 [Heracleum sosnowskyi]